MAAVALPIRYLSNRLLLHSFGPVTPDLWLSWWGWPRAVFGGISWRFNGPEGCGVGTWLKRTAARLRRDPDIFLLTVLKGAAFAMLSWCGVVAEEQPAALPPPQPVSAARSARSAGAASRAGAGGMSRAGSARSLAVGSMPPASGPRKQRLASPPPPQDQDASPSTIGAAPASGPRRSRRAAAPVSRFSLDAASSFFQRGVMRYAPGAPASAGSLRGGHPTLAARMLSSSAAHEGLKVSPRKQQDPSLPRPPSGGDLALAASAAAAAASDGEGSRAGPLTATRSLSLMMGRPASPYIRDPSLAAGGALADPSGSRRYASGGDVGGSVRAGGGSAAAEGSVVGGGFLPTTLGPIREKRAGVGAWTGAAARLPRQSSGAPSPATLSQDAAPAMLDASQLGTPAAPPVPPPPRRYSSEGMQRAMLSMAARSSAAAALAPDAQQGLAPLPEAAGSASQSSPIGVPPPPRRAQSLLLNLRAASGEPSAVPPMPADSVDGGALLSARSAPRQMSGTGAAAGAEAPAPEPSVRPARRTSAPSPRASSRPRRSSSSAATATAFVPVIKQLPQQDASVAPGPPARRSSASRLGKPSGASSSAADSAGGASSPPPAAAAARPTSPPVRTASVRGPPLRSRSSLSSSAAAPPTTVAAEQPLRRRAQPELRQCVVDASFRGGTGPTGGDLVLSPRTAAAMSAAAMSADGTAESSASWELVSAPMSSAGSDAGGGFLMRRPRRRARAAVNVFGESEQRIQEVHADNVAAIRFQRKLRLVRPPYLSRFRSTPSSPLPRLANVHVC